MGKRVADKGQAVAPSGDQTARALRERVKELSCLYRINRISEGTIGSPDEVFQRIVELIPPAWQYPEIASARIVLDGKRYETPGFDESLQRQSCEVVVDAKCRGAVDVIYREARPALDEGPFLNDERDLLDAIARQIAIIVEHQDAEQETARLQKQLMHADRLATIGQLAAGVAHELNEPLSSILGFAQLLKRDPALPESGRHDIERIVAASLHAREIIKKLLLFARQTPTFKGPVDLNQVVVGAVDLFKHQFEKEGIELSCVLCPRMPMLAADAGQLIQVLVNLVVNAVHAMPRGGRLTIETQVQDGHVACSVQDTGVGMTEEVLDRLFVPFFTTKEVRMVGDSRARKVDVRIVAATNKDLPSLIQSRVFREELYYRINVVTIEVPPLRARGGDIPLLVRHFAEKFAEELGKTVPRFSEKAMEAMQHYAWPGNIRELENVIQRIVVMNDEPIIEIPDLPSFARFSALRTSGVNGTLADVEADHIRNVLANADGNKTRAAEILGIDRKTLRKKIGQYNLD